MKANILSMVSSLSAAISDHEKNIETYHMQEQQGKDEGLEVDNTSSIVAEQNQIEQLKTEFLANENFFKEGDMALLTMPDTEPFETQVTGRELVDNNGSLDILYQFDGVGSLFQSDLDKEGYESERA